MGGTEEAIRQLIQGLTLIGGAVNYFIGLLLSLLGLQVPEIVLRIGKIVVLILAIWRFNDALSKVVIFSLVFLLLSQVGGLRARLLKN